MGWWHLTPSGQAVIDEQGVVIQVNQTLSDWLHAPIDCLMHRPASEIFTPEARVLYLGLMVYRVAERGSADEIHLTLQVKGGEPMPVLCSARQIVHQSVRFTLLSMLSIVRKDYLERELIEMRHAAQRALAEKSAAVGELEALRDNLKAQRTTLEQANNRLEKEALSDALTTLPNRRRFDQVLDQWLREASLSGSSTFSVAMLDIDHFKPVNDRHGHAAGDRVLRQFSELITSRLRNDDLAARIGGEEFGLLMPGAGTDAAQYALERLRHAVEIHDWNDLAITLSIGVTEYRPGDIQESLMQRADDALYAAKRTGRNRVVTG